MLATITGTGNGSAPVVNITFPYIDASHVKASVNDVDVVATWTGPSQVTFATTVPLGSTWKVYRDTPTSPAIVDFTDGSVLTEADLDLAETSHRYRDEELLDRISEGSDGTDRSLKVPSGETVADLPSAAVRAGKFLSFDAGGAPVMSSGQGSDANLRSDLALSTGAALVGKTGGGTVQDALNKLGSEDYSASPSVSNAPVSLDKTWVGVSLTPASNEPISGSDYRGILVSTKFNGTHGGFQQNAGHFQCEVRNAGSPQPLTYAQGVEAYVRVGYNATIDANVSAVNVFAGHVANEAPNAAIPTAMVFRAKDTDWNTGVAGSNGTIQNNYGFYSGDLSHATKLTGAAAGFYANNMTTPTPGVTVAAFLSDMSGTGKWTLLARQNAPSAHVGTVRIGDTQVAVEKLEVAGNIKATGYVIQKPPASVTPANNGEMTFQLTNDTTLVVKVKGSDGVVRSATLTLA